MADDTAGMDFDAYEDAANQPMVCSLSTQQHKLLDKHGVHADRQTGFNVHAVACQWFRV